MASLEICMHCYKYSKLLNLCLSSYYYNKNSLINSVKIIIYTCPEDQLTISVCDYFKTILPIEIRLLPRPFLLSRGYGRNLAVRKSLSDWIWFADCDHCIGKNTLFDLFENLYKTTSFFVHPYKCITNKYGEDLELFLENLEIPNPIPIDFTQLKWATEIKLHNASGGQQIFRVDKIKKIGYYYKHKKLDYWQRTYEDVDTRKLFLKSFPNSLQKINIRDYVHLRHVKRGRFNKEISL